MRTSNLFIGLAAVALVVAACGGGSSRTTVRLMAGPTVGPKTAIEDLPSVSKVGRRAVDFDPIKLAGKGSKTVRVRIPKDVGAIARISSSDRKAFMVWEIDADDASPTLLVNRVGRYRGTVLLNLAGGLRALKVKASGKWSITIRPALDAETWDPDEKLSGKGDLVVRIGPPADGLEPLAFKHDGKRTFAVWAYGLTASDQLAAGIGAATHTLLVPDGSLLLRVEADGAWSIEPA